MLSSSLCLLCVASILVPSGLAGCPPGAALYPRHGRCYWLTSSVANASASHSQCQQGGGELAELWTMDVIAFVTSQLQLPTYQGCSVPPCRLYWLGHRDSGTGTLVTWEGKKTCWNTTPAAGSPCVILMNNNGSAKVYSSDCSVLWLAVCSKSLGEVEVLQERWRAVKGTRMSSQLVGASRMAASASHCARACEIMSCCSTFSFRKSDGLCELSVAHSALISWALTSDPAFAHFQRVH